MRAVAFSPGHVTGFVEFPVVRDDPLLYGSLGAGFCITRGVETVIEAEESARNEYSIKINGKLANDAEVSQYVVQEYLKLADKNYKITVGHQTQIPIGYGLGSSGAAALSLSLALNEALGRILSKVEAAQIAHRADLACKCGVGTVLTEFHGGFEMRKSPGAPGIGSVENIPLGDRKAVLLCIAPLLTKDFLTNKIQLINGLGGKMLRKLGKTRSPDDFMEMSFEFASSIGLTNNRCENVLNELVANGYRCSTAMFGETVFCLAADKDVEDVTKIMSRHQGQLLVCDVDNEGARLC